MKSFYLQFRKETQIAIQAALKAGKLLKTGFFEAFGIQNKEGIHNLVTDFDFSSEKLILDLIKKNFKNHGFWAEESGDTSQNENVIWYIDPLDGTVNFAHHVPHFCISIAAYENQKPFLGVIYQPMTDELFVAESLKGAFLNEKQITVTSTDTLEKSFLATGFPYDIAQKPISVIESFTHFARQGIPIRRIGSAALDLAYVAAGCFDGFFEIGLGPWDIAAGSLLVTEAKGKVTNPDGTPLLLKKYSSIIASNGKIHDLLVLTLKDKL